MRIVTTVLVSSASAEQICNHMPNSIGYWLRVTQSAIQLNGREGRLIELFEWTG